MLCLVKLGMMLQSENCPPIMWKLKGEENYKEIGSDLQDQIIVSSKQLWEEICLDC